MANKRAALVIGACSHGLSVIRALHSEGVNVFVVEKDKKILGVKSNNILQTFFVNSFSAEDLLSELPKIREKLREWEDLVLFSTNDNHVKFVCDNSEILAKHFKISWQEHKETIKKLIDKRNLEEFSLRAGLNYPKSAILDQSAQPVENLNLFRFPVIVKPAKPLSSFKTQMAHNVTEVENLMV